MILKIKCPSCGRQFSIELTEAMREIERLKRDNADLRERLAAKEAMDKNDPLSAIKKAMGL